MKKTAKMLFGLIAMIAVIGFGMAACSDDPGGPEGPGGNTGKGSLTIVNGGDVMGGGSGSAITSVYVSRIVQSDSESGMDWGSNLLSGSINQGSERTFELPGAGNYNIKVGVGSSSYYRWDFKVSGNTTIYFVRDGDGEAKFNAGAGASGFTTKLTVKAQGVSSTGFQLYWNEIPGAFGYLLYASVGSPFYNTPGAYEIDAGYLQGYTVDTMQDMYNGTAGQTYYFHIIAFDKNGDLLSDINDGKAQVTLNAAAVYTLDGLWYGEFGSEIEFSSSTGKGIIRAFSNIEPTGLALDARQKGYWKIGLEIWKNVKSAGTNEWKGDKAGLKYKDNKPEVCNGIGYFIGHEFTLSEDGQTLTVRGESSSVTHEITTSTYTRRRPE